MESYEDVVFLKEEESKVDRLSAGITEYAIKLSSLQISEKEHQDVAHLLQTVSDIERISDYCENISEFAENLYQKKLRFSKVGTEQLKEMLDVCAGSYQYAIEAFKERSKEKALKVIEKETRADDLEITLRSKHIKRLTNGECNTEAGDCLLGYFGLSGTYFRPCKEYCRGSYGADGIARVKERE